VPQVEKYGAPRLGSGGDFECGVHGAFTDFSWQLNFIVKQMGHRDVTMLVDIYAKWMDSESPYELERIWKILTNSN
jgi:integrase